MSLMKKALADKILVLGIDGMDPATTKRLLDAGKMPNLQEYLKHGSAREDLVLLGAHPTITPPMWTTLATGAYPMTHGITCYYRQSGKGLDTVEYNLNSKYCLAEQIWNVFAEDGKKTLVWHWPGSSWPPSSDSENLYVVDGTSPGGVCQGTATVDAEQIVVADYRNQEVRYLVKGAAGGRVPCVMEDVDISSTENTLAAVADLDYIKVIMINKDDGEASVSETTFDSSLSPIKDATGWSDAPEGSKEFTMLHSGGLVRRICLLLKNDQGVYDRVSVYKSKKDREPLVVLPYDTFVSDVFDDAIKNDVHYTVNRSMRVLEIAPDGSHVKIWVSAGLDIEHTAVWHPQTLHKHVTKNAGYPQPTCILGGSDKQLLTKCMMPAWENLGQWQARALNYLIEQEGFEAIFSHYHILDLIAHMIIKFFKTGRSCTGQEYQQILDDAYIVTDKYFGGFLHLLDKGWTVVLVSDHGLVCPEEEPPLFGDFGGVNVGLMRDLGYTVLCKDENGEDIREIDWTQTKAVACRANHIYLNLKGREAQGIVEPAERYELEEQIITDLYSYKHPATGKRCISLALRNKDAVLVGMSGDLSGDIIAFVAEGYNYDHGDSLTTCLGHGGTSVSPFFVIAGKGVKHNYYTDRVIRQVDVAPTIAVLCGVRVPAQCEGAPIYQIMEERM